MPKIITEIKSLNVSNGVEHRDGIISKQRSKNALLILGERFNE
jgi:hypothetical protein